MTSRLQSRARGTVSLVALCFVTVLGIVLASYLTICSRAMNLSNRSYQAGVAQQLAELGLEEGLRAFNKGDSGNWTSTPANMTSGSWTFDSANKRASRVITFNSGKLGQGITATVKIRIDNYDAAIVGAPYSSSVAYRVNDLVSSGGLWYRSVQNGNTGNAVTGTGGYPNLAYWAPEPIPWRWVANHSYTAYVDVVNNGGTWYRCIANHTSGATFAVGSNWASLPAAPVLAIYTNTSYAAGTFAFRIGGSQWLRCNVTHTVNSTWDATEAGKWDAADSSTPSSTAPAISWAWRSGITYNFNDLVYYSATNGVAGSWYRCKVASSSNAPNNTTDWEAALSGIWAWSSSSLKYNVGDVVYNGTSWYRCIQAHTSSGSFALTNAAYWSPDPLCSPVWDSNRLYNQNDTAYYNGLWYRCIWSGGNSGQNPATASSSYWVAANNSTYVWNSATTYSGGNYCAYGGVWYKCTNGNTGQSPNNTSYWTPTWSGSLGVTTGAAVVYAEATVTIAGSPPIRTQLRAAINPAPAVPNALGSTDTLTLSAGGTIDSFDSTTAAYSSPGGYSAVVASTYSGGTAVTNFGATIQGYVSAASASSSPYAPLASFGGNAVVKSNSSPASPKVDLSRVSRSPYVPQFDTVPGGSGGLVAAWGSTPKSTALVTTGSALALNIGTPGATTPARYWCSGLTIDGTNIASLTINGPVILYCSGNLVLGGGTANTITIASTGSAEIHVGGSLNINQTSGGIVNQTKDPKKAVLISDNAGASTLNYSDGDNDFYGVIYAPYTGSSSGFVVDNSSVQLYGAISAKKIAYSQDANVHYDTSLRYNPLPGVDQPYMITDWRILPQTEQATMP